MFITIYTYGKYGDNKDGLLYILRDEAAEGYLESKWNDEYSVHVITDISDNVIDDIMNLKIEEGKINFPDKFTETKDGKNIRLKIDEYNLLTNNCTTFTSDVINLAGSNVLKNISPFSRQENIRPAVPSALRDHLNYRSKYPNFNVYKNQINS